MSMVFEERGSDSPYIDLVTFGHTLSDGSTIRPAEYHWHMVFVKVNRRILPLVVGPLTAAGIATWGEDAEILWIKFKPGVFMPHLPPGKIINAETALPDASNQSFWLKSSTWQIPDYENVETFVDWLVRDEILIPDPVVNAALNGQLRDVPARTVRHRFLRATGLTQTHIHQVARAQRAADLLRQGNSILDTVFEAGYYDQPHMTRALKQWVGYTPAQLVRMGD